MSAQDVVTRHVVVNGSRCRVLEQGSGAPLVVLSGHGGVPGWGLFHAQLARTRRVIVPSLPGQQGSERGHEALHNPLDWVAMLLDLLDACGQAGPVDLIAESVAGMLAGELAALTPERLRKLVLIGPYGLYDEAEPTVNLYALSPSHRPGCMVKDKAKYAARFNPPAEADDAAKEEWGMLAYRADEAAARLAWPFGDFKLIRRLHRVATPLLLVWGAEDQLVPASYAQRFAKAVAGPSRIEVIPGAGHLASVDAPEQAAKLAIEFLAG